MRAWEVMIGNKQFNLLDAIMFAYTYRGKVFCMEQLNSTGMKEVYHRVRRELISISPKLKNSPHPLADFCINTGKGGQRECLKRLNV